MDGSQLVGYADPIDEISIEVRHRPRPLKRLLIGAAAVVFLAGAGIYGDYWWTTGRFMVSTADASVQASEDGERTLDRGSQSQCLGTRGVFGLSGFARVAG